MSLTPQETHEVMRKLGEIDAKLCHISENIGHFNLRINEIERKVSRHTGIIAIIGGACLFFRDKIMQILGAA
jgi:hypothetical protein